MPTPDWWIEKYAPVILVLHHLYSFELEPEILHQDGERPRSEARQREDRLNRLVSELAWLTGHRLTESEVETILKNKRLVINKGLDRF